MAHIDPASIRVLAEADIPAALSLSRAAKWNQTGADWRHFMHQGAVFGLDQNGILVATAAIMPYGDDRGWIGMVLTEKAQRGKGFGTLMLNHCLATLAAQNRAALLDATPAGEPLYRALGFTGTWSSTRWRRTSSDAAPQQATSAPSPIDPSASAADGAAFGVQRNALLADFAARMPQIFQSTPNGVCFGRNGDIATQIGPIACTSESAGLELLDTALARTTGTVILDIPDDAEATAAYVREQGFAPERPFLRMIKGTCANPESAWRHIAIAGPEFG